MTLVNTKKCAELLFNIQGKITWSVFAGALAKMIEENAGFEEDRYKETFRVRLE